MLLKEPFSTKTAVIRMPARSLDNAALSRLLERLSEGDSSSLGELYDLCSRDVYGFALWKTASPEDAAGLSTDDDLQPHGGCGQASSSSFGVGGGV